MSKQGRVEQELTNHLYRETLGASQATPFDLPQVVRASVVQFILTRETHLQTEVERLRRLKDAATNVVLREASLQAEVVRLRGIEKAAQVYIEVPANLERFKKLAAALAKEKMTP